MSRVDVLRMIRHRASEARIKTAMGCHTFRATGITDYLKNGGRIDVAQRMAGHSNSKTMGLCPASRIRRAFITALRRICSGAVAKKVRYSANTSSSARL